MSLFWFVRSADYKTFIFAEYAVGKSMCKPTRNGQLDINFQSLKFPIFFLKQKFQFFPKVWQKQEMSSNRDAYA